MAKSNYNFQKRQKEQARKKKKEEKRQRKLADKVVQDNDNEEKTISATEE